MRDFNTLKAITSQADQEVGLTDEQIRIAADRPGKYGENLREARGPQEGVLLIYPISRYSGHGESSEKAEPRRVPIYDNPDQGEDIIGIAVVFPLSESAAAREYVTGTVVSPED